MTRAERPGPRYLTIAAAAEFLSLSPSGLRKLVGRGIIPAIRLGRTLRVDARELERRLAEQLRAAGSAKW